MIRFLLSPLLLSLLPHRTVISFTTTISSSYSFRSKVLFQATKSTHQSTLSTIQIVTEMPPPLPPNLKNKYFLLRHGQSYGNVEGVISSSRRLANSTKHGLTPLGYQQGRESAEQLLQLLSSSSSEEKKVVFYSSPFARAKETAQACLDGLNEDWKEDVEKFGLEIHQDVILEDKLMERYFGRLDFQDIKTYAYVWPLDLFNVTHTAFDVESVAAVATRIRETLLEMDSKYENINVILVSHADVLQITQVYAAGAENVGEFSQYRFGNGEVREMKRNVDSLPEPKPLEPPKRGT